MIELEEQVNQLINQILLKAENQYELLIGQCRSKVKLTNTQEHILMLLSEGQKTNSELAKALNVNQAAVTKAVKTLVKEGMLEGKKDKDDGRVTYFVLTQEAQPIAQEQIVKTKSLLDSLLKKRTANKVKTSMKIKRIISLLKMVIKP
ncbi:MarR family transcriptional regulator, partial [Klebsiella pneumoniae]|nr:MarR family transcriptional regulator [Klebsiella pneumoniae]